MPPDEPTPEQIRDEQVFLKMGLNASEYEEVARRLGRLPNLTETGIFGVMWSEHCSYKNSKPLLGRYPTEGQRILQGPGEGAGVVDLGEDWAAVFKVESHNHPSAIEPYQDAATGGGSRACAASDERRVPESCACCGCSTSPDAAARESARPA